MSSMDKPSNSDPLVGLARWNPLGTTTRARIAWWLFDLLMLVIFIGLMFTVLELDYWKTFKVATRHPWLFKPVFLMVIILVGFARVYWMEGNHRYRYRYRQGMSLFAVGAAILDLGYSFEQDIPSPIGALSRVLDSSPARTVTLVEIPFAERRHTSNMIWIGDLTYRMVKPEDDKGKPFWPDEDRKTAQWHSGAIGIPWIESPSFDYLPNFYRVSIFGPGIAPHTDLSRLRNRRLVVVIVDSCITRDHPGYLEQVRALAERFQAVAISQYAVNDPCSTTNSTDAADAIIPLSKSDDGFEDTFPQAALPKAGTIYLYPPEAAWVVSHDPPWLGGSPLESLNFPASPPPRN